MGRLNQVEDLSIHFSAQVTDLRTEERNNPLEREGVANAPVIKASVIAK